LLRALHFHFLFTATTMQTFGRVVGELVRFHLGGITRLRHIESVRFALFAVARIGFLPVNGTAPRMLRLGNVGQFVCEQAISVGRAWCVLPSAKMDVLAVGERTRAKRASGLGRCGAIEYAHGWEFCA